jgi:hypothetical protein
MNARARLVHASGALILLKYAVGLCLVYQLAARRTGLLRSGPDIHKALQKRPGRRRVVKTIGRARHRGIGFGANSACDQPQDICPTHVNQGVHAATSQPNKIGPATRYDFNSKNLTAYGGLLPVGTLLEKLGFRQLVEETLRVKRQTSAMPAYQFILAMVLGLLRGFLATASHAVSAARAHADGNPGRVAARRSVPSGGSWPLCTAAWPANCWKYSDACDSEYGKRPMWDSDDRPSFLKTPARICRISIS